MHSRVRLWLPVVISLFLQVPIVAVLAWRSEGRSGWLLAVGLALVGPLALIGARRFPGPVVAVVTAAAGALVLVRPDIGAPYVALGFAIVLGIVRGARVWVYASVGAVWLVTIVLASAFALDVHPLRAAGTTLALALLIGLGEAVRNRRERFAEFRRTAEVRRLTAEQRERVRIARELHDVLAHSLSQINVQAGVGLHLIDTQPEKAAEALASIKSTSKNALDEVRMVLGILRADGSDGSDQPGGAGPSDGSAAEGVSGVASGAPLAPEPDLSALPALVDSFRAQGMAVDLRNELDDDEPVAAATGLALYRISQEALTNVLRHAHASATSVHLRVEGADYVLTVTDDGPDAPANGTISPNGGLLGMRERAELLGGGLRVARQEPAGLRVEARLPRGSRR